MTGHSRKRQSGLSGNQLKEIAIGAMLLDHIGAFILGYLPIAGTVEKGQVFANIYILLRIVGRLAFPIFAFLLTEGFFHTKSVKKYLLRLGTFALLSEIPFDLALYEKVGDFSMQNVFFTLFIGLFTMYFMEKWEKYLFFCMLVALASSFISWFLKTDYGGLGFLLILVFFIFHNRRKEQLAAGAVVMVSMMQRNWEIGYLASLPLLYQYNGINKKSEGAKRYAVYLFYPLHLMVLVGIRLLLVS
ncbi:TraX family protein [Lachnospiraceae bacterium 62-35]